MDNIKYDEIKASLEDEARLYQTDEAKEVRWTVSKLQSDIAYYQYRIFLAQRKIQSLNDDYQKLIGVVHETTENVQA